MTMRSYTELTGQLPVIIICSKHLHNITIGRQLYTYAIDGHTQQDFPCFGHSEALSVHSQISNQVALASTKMPKVWVVCQSDTMIAFSGTRLQAPYLGAFPNLYASSGRICSASIQPPPPCNLASDRDSFCTMSCLQQQACNLKHSCTSLQALVGWRHIVNGSVWYLCSCVKSSSMHAN